MKNIELIDAFKEKLYTLIKTKEVDENRDLRELGVNSIIIMKLSAFLKRSDRCRMPRATVSSRHSRLPR